MASEVGNIKAVMAVAVVRLLTATIGPRTRFRFFRLLSRESNLGEQGPYCCYRQLIDTGFNHTTLLPVRFSLRSYGARRFSLRRRRPAVNDEYPKWFAEDNSGDLSAPLRVLTSIEERWKNRHVFLESKATSYVQGLGLDGLHLGRRMVHSITLRGCYSSACEC